ncbi:Polysaccharide deacetylase [Mariniphaga anaerophila]|uniref:Polysaccharide deacetylase n=1 Tax=Mariniphaga anaerophila TaxID=1484053 RepID=A0A1M5B8G5_9BACT|nr:polysaccharide deacetylase family protein [Mariniphaga anaerophila]SHF38779.1 Polysaccharide deacetylase [Mariniphaga anaerophila]
MRKLARNVSKILSSACSEQWLFKRNTPCFLPFYHVVSDNKLPHILNYPYRNIARFEEELDFFLKYFVPVSLEELISEKSSGKKIFHLTFDDGLRESYDVIAPILLKKGIPATFFVNTAFVDNHALFHKYKASIILNRLMKKTHPETLAFLKKNGLAVEEILKVDVSRVGILNEAATMLGIDFEDFLHRQKPYLSSSQIRSLNMDGFTIGAHSHSHPEFWKISEEEQIKEIKESMARVEELVSPPIKAFSFPFTDDGVPASVLRVVKDEHICDVTFGTAGVKNDPFSSHFQRYPVELPGSFVRNLKGEFVYYELRKLVGKATMKH